MKAKKKKKINFKRFLIKLDFEKILTLGYESNVPQRNLLMGYLSYIIFGLVLISLPFSQKVPISFIDNLFNITSAVSTSGLVTTNIHNSYTFFGQFIILLFIQLGGIGYMTLSSFIMYNLTHHFMRIKNGVMRATFSIPVEFNMQSLVKSIVWFSLFFEVIGAIILFVLFKQAGVSHSFWNAIFISISAFCTAGFSLFDNSLMAFDTNYGVNIVVALLCYVGAMGFIVLIDFKNKLKDKVYRITFTSKIIVTITLLLTIIGTVQLYFFEPSLNNYSPKDKFLVSFFQSVSAMSTGGFNSVDIGHFGLASVMTISVLMFIGASPSGTGGGIKTTTLSAVFAFVTCKLGNKRDVMMGSHRLPTYRVDSALTNIIFYGFILFLGTYILTFTENFSLSQIIVETTSALGTVGLSTGITPDFSVSGKVILCILMYIGRVGVLSFGTVMLTRMSKKEKNVVKKEILDEDDIAI